MTSISVRLIPSAIRHYDLPNELDRALEEQHLSISPTGGENAESSWYAFEYGDGFGLDAFGRSPSHAVASLLTRMRIVAAQPHWADSCTITKVKQVDPYGCGVACLAMVGGATYMEARAIFTELGLDRPTTKGRPPYASNFTQLTLAVTASKMCSARIRKWKGWQDIQKHAIMKVSSSTGGRNWHWVVAERHSVYGIVIHDPASVDPSFQKAPHGVMSVPFDRYQPTGNWLEIY